MATVLKSRQRCQLELHTLEINLGILFYKNTACVWVLFTYNTVIEGRVTAWQHPNI